MAYKIKSIYFPLAFLLAATPIQAANNACPSWLMKRSGNIPTCPAEGSLVPETYPAGAVIVSDLPVMQDIENPHDSGFTADVVEKVLTAAGDNNPLLILPVTDNTIEQVKARIDQMPISREQKEKYKKSIIQVPAMSYTWQQDYFQPFTNPKTGKTVLREIAGYKHHVDIGDSFAKLMEATKACGFEMGPPLKGDNPDDPKDFNSGQMGGNIETLPAGICIFGDDHFKTTEKWKKYADQVCAEGDANRIKVPTSWLKVGHTDEIMKVVRNKNAKAPCDFSVVIASPKKGLELLRKNPDGKFLDFSRARTTTPDIAGARSQEYDGLWTICSEVFTERNRKDNERSSKPGRGVTQLFDLQRLLFRKAHAGVPEVCANATNKEVSHAIENNKELRIYNQLVQEKMDALKAEVTQKLKNKLPQCEPDFLEVPDIFFGGAPIEKENGKYELPDKMALSVLPNPTNNISINDTIIAPDPANDVFMKYMKEEYAKRGLKSEFVDTFDYAHQGNGNLHCSTNTIHICKPKR